MALDAYDKKLREACDYYASHPDVSLSETARQYSVNRLDMIHELMNRGHAFMQGITEEEAREDLRQLLNQYSIPEPTTIR